MNIKKERRKEMADRFAEWVTKYVVEPDDVDVTYSLEAGVEYANDWNVGVRRAKANGSWTFTIKINGGAHETEGPPIGFPATEWQKL